MVYNALITGIKETMENREYSLEAKIEYDPEFGDSEDLVISVRVSKYLGREKKNKVWSEISKSSEKIIAGLLANETSAKKIKEIEEAAFIISAEVIGENENF